MGRAPAALRCQKRFSSCSSQSEKRWPLAFQPAKVAIRQVAGRRAELRADPAAGVQDNISRVGCAQVEGMKDICVFEVDERP